MENFTSLPNMIHPNDIILLKSGSKTTLPQLFRAEFEKIRRDLTKLKHRNILESS